MKALQRTFRFKMAWTSKIAHCLLFTAFLSFLCFAWLAGFAASVAASLGALVRLRPVPNCRPEKVPTLHRVPTINK